MWYLYAFVVVAGALNALQSGANSTLNKTLDQPLVAGLIVLAFTAIGLCAVGAVYVPLSWPEPSRWERLPWWAWIGGLLGASVLSAQLLIAHEIGASPSMGIIVTAAIVTSLVLDHFGLMGFEEHRQVLGALGCRPHDRGRGPDRTYIAYRLVLMETVK